jgi:hypothetical protein
VARANQQALAVVLGFGQWVEIGDELRPGGCAAISTSARKLQKM